MLLQYHKPPSSAAAHRIVQYKASLGQKQTCPVGMCSSWESSTPFEYITSSNTTPLPHIAAQLAQNLSDKHHYFQTWSTHFIWVATTNMLHCANFSNLFIHDYLQWKSSLFFMYLRHAFYFKWSHNPALVLKHHGLLPEQLDTTHPSKLHKSTWSLVI